MRPESIMMEFKLTNDNQISYSLANNSRKVSNTQESDRNVLRNQNDISLSTQQKLELSSWGLPQKVLEFYHSKRITHMFSWQFECLTLGRVLNAGNLVYSAPTSAGKTLVAEILISKCLFELQKKILVILPFVSVVREKMFYFQGMYASSGIHVEGYMGGHSPSLSFKQVHLAVCTIEKANSIINKLLKEESLQNLGLVVVDELHLLSDPYRGYLLELLLTKIKYISLKTEFKIQIVGMSATLPNLKLLADWLNADVYYTDFRPVPLKEKLKCGNVLYDKKLNELSTVVPLATEIADDVENVGQLCVETISNGHSVLIFCPTKIWCENLAEKISMFFRKIGCSKSAETEGTPGWILRKELNLEKINEIIAHLKMSPVGLDKDLQKTIAYGVAFHHAGLTLEERDIIEGSFRQGSIRVVCATSTLSSGVNLPARRVIIRSPMSFGGLMDTLTYRQMIGRAGRMGIDSEGESILICKPSEKSICQTLMCSNLKPIESCLGHGKLSASLKRALLEIIASGIVSTPEDVKKYAACTFLACSSKHDLEDPLQSCIEFLEENEFIRFQGKGTVYTPTPLAKACLASSLPPDEGLALFRELQRARRCFVLDTDLHIIYQVTPYSVSEQWNKLDWFKVLSTLEGLPETMKRVGEMVGVEESFLVKVVKGTLNSNTPDIRNKLSIHRRFYTSLALQELVNEVSLAEVAEKYECNKGMLQSLQQSAATYAGMVTEFTRCLGWSSVELIFSQFQERLQFGIRQELCELMRLPLLNAKRARALYEAGFTSLSGIANANFIELENVFFNMTPFQSKKEIAGETTFDREQRNKLEAIWITGKANLSVREVVESLVTECRNILEIELGLKGVEWGKKAAIFNDTHERKLNFPTPAKVLSEGSPSEWSVSCDKSLSAVGHNSFVNGRTGFGIECTNRETLPGIEMKNNMYENDKNNTRTGKLSKCDAGLTQNTKVGKTNEDLQETNPLQISVEGEVHKLSKKVSSSEKLFESAQSVSVGKEINLNKDRVADAELRGHRTPASESDKIEADHFASSSGFNVVPVHELPLNVFCQAIDSNDDNEDGPFVVNESDSDSSVEILYESALHDATKNLSFSRFSDDMLEMSRRGDENLKNMSTPIAAHCVKNLEECEVNRNRLSDTRSLDLFSQSLTFDTQMFKILDFEERSAEENPQVVINPSSSVNSDDLGFVSDLSPKPRKVHVEGKFNSDEKRKEKNNHHQEADANALRSESETETFSKERENGTKVEEVTKRKTLDSPDLMMNSFETENFHPSKRVKYNVPINKEIFPSPSTLKETESDDEIMPTPEFDKTRLSNALKISKVRSRTPEKDSPDTWKKTNWNCNELLKNENAIKVSGTNEPVTFCPENSSKEKESLINLEGLRLGRISVIDVCKEERNFKFFHERLKKQNILGVALGCRRKIEKTSNSIGVKITKTAAENVREKFSGCHFNDVVLDGIAFYWEDNNVFYMSMDDGDVALDVKVNVLKNLSRKNTFRIFDAKEQIKMLHRCCNVLVTASLQDPRVASWLLAENWKDQNFSALVSEFLPSFTSVLSLLGTIVGHSSPGLCTRSTVPPKTRACLEAFLTYHVIDQQLPLLLEKGLLKAYEITEMPIMLCLAEMEVTGFQIQRNSLQKVVDKLKLAKTVLEEKAYSIARQRFTISSSLAVSKVLYKILPLGSGSVPLTRKKKLPSTSKQALEELADLTKHPLPQVILEWRKVRSISTKFISPLLQITSHSTMVAGVSQTFTLTGRISMHEPNLQNTPKNFDINFAENESISINLREVFVASENCFLMSVDYCQIELRVLAHLSRDIDLIRNIKHSSDIFVSIGATVFGVPHNEVNDSLRQRAKQICYGMIYGIGPRSLARQLQVNESQATKLIYDFKNKYQGVKNYLEKIIGECKKNGYVTTLFKRRRYIPAINDANQEIRMEGERQAVNTTVQGSAADLVKMAMVLLREKIAANKIVARLVLHLHDELIFEVGGDSLEAAASLLKDTMENAVNITVPTPVKIKIGSNWGQLKDFEA